MVDKVMAFSKYAVRYHLSMPITSIPELISIIDGLTWLRVLTDNDEWLIGNGSKIINIECEAGKDDEFYNLVRVLCKRCGCEYLEVDSRIPFRLMYKNPKLAKEKLSAAEVVMVPFKGAAWYIKKVWDTIDLRRRVISLVV